MAAGFYRFFVDSALFFIATFLHFNYTTPGDYSHPKKPKIFAFIRN